MAGDWIKAEHCLTRKPEVVQMSSILGMDRYAVAGRLLDVWSWFDSHTLTGKAPGVTSAFIDSLVAHEGFAASMTTVGWLDNRNGSLVVPNFDRHISKSAKERALGSKRVQRSRNAPTVTVPLPEKRREEKSINTPLPPFETEPLKTIVQGWLTYRKEIGKPYKPKGLEQFFNLVRERAAHYGDSGVAAAIQKAMANGSQGWDFESSYPKTGAFGEVKQRLLSPEEEMEYSPHG